VARQLANLDHLSGGRVICAVGLGYRAEDFTSFGEVGEPTVRARQLDEGLTILDGLWRHDSFSFASRYYTLTDVALHPRPLQSPRIPLWVAGGWPRRAPFRRAARWDGVCIISVDQATGTWLSHEALQECVAYVRSQRMGAGPFDVVMSGELAEDRQEALDQAARCEAAGATWWLEEGFGWTLEEFRERVRRGPPRG
jgi:alkanesulfonate monooxygenase SsuD/methylene tetrahydromethanopterin reductase-like flavin-dependent oxidoreductase (luciferase family)